MRFRVSAHVLVHAANRAWLLARTGGCSIGLGLAAFGCAHSDTIADRRAIDLRETIDEVQAEQDRNGRHVGFIETMAADERVTSAPSRPAAPPLAVRHTVQIGDVDNPRESDDPNDPNARPEIRLQGPGSAARPVRGKSVRGHGEVRIDPSVDDAASSDGVRSSALDPEAKQAYESALALVNSKQYDRAIEALAAFLVRWPDHPYAENALYWRGESYYARGEYLRAAEQFEAVLARFGGGSKAADALLKLGMSHDRLGATDRAKETWERLRRDYPRSDATKKIPSNQAKPSDARGAVGPKESR